MNLADSRMDCLRGCLATLSILVVRIALLEYSKIHEKAYKCIVCEFGGFQNVLRDACVAPSLHRESTDSLIVHMIFVLIHYDCILLTIAPPSITELMYDGFTCDVSLEVISLEISWTVSMIILFDLFLISSIILYSQSGSREEGVIYPDIINTSIQLRPVLNGLIIEQLCSDDSHTTCTVVITRDVYRLTVIRYWTDILSR